MFQSNPGYQASIDMGASGLQFILCAPTSPAQRVGDETLTNLNRGKRCHSPVLSNVMIECMLFLWNLVSPTSQILLLYCPWIVVYAWRTLLCLGFRAFFWIWDLGMIGRWGNGNIIPTRFEGSQASVTLPISLFIMCSSLPVRLGCWFTIESSLEWHLEVY